LDRRDFVNEVVIRPLEPTDDLGELTELIHRAYAALGRMGLNYTGVDQSIEVTAERCADGEAWVVLDVEGALVATATLTFPDPFDSCKFFRDLGQVALNQVAVHPDVQRQGLGRMLIEQLEQRAIELGYRTIALDTAIPAQHLVEWYRRLGYEPIGEHQWEGKSYRSLVMHKVLS
jgi:GNAT superfamily N-acetyltransferase